MPQVIIVSARLPVSVKKIDGQLSYSASIGGLATGLSSYIKDQQNIWVGWPGIPSDLLTEQDKQEIIIELAKYHCSPVFLSNKQLDGFYNGYSNTILWPLFHELKTPVVDSGIHKRWWRSYQTVNREFSEAVLSLVRNRSHVWVHDYQLLLLPKLLRQELPMTSIGFFLHIPFPGYKTFTKLPEQKRLLEGVLGSDLVGFHTTSYTDKFLENCLEENFSIVGQGQIFAHDHLVRIAEFPMGIDYKKYASARKSREVKAAVKRYKKRYKGLKVIAAVDRVDPSKGLLERLSAYKLLLQQNPRLEGKVVFAMIAAPSRTDVPAYQRLSKKLSAAVTDINQEFGTPLWQPIDYINRSMPFEEVSALFAVADIAFIAPLKDGMNLAAKEFIASKRKGGTLILSETAGAAEELRDALLVDPTKPATVVEALQQSLMMPRREVRRRMKRMKKQLESNTVQTWAKAFIDNLQRPIPGPRFRASALQGKHEAALLKAYKKSKNRLLLLDYDGTLVPFSADYKAASPPAAVLTTLDKLKAGQQNDVVLVSGRSSSDLERWFAQLHINLVGEHGAVSKAADSKSWKTSDKAENRWKKAVLPILEEYAHETPSARVENKPHSLVWHYRNAPPYYAQKNIVIIKRLLKPALRTYGLQLCQGNKILEIKDPRLNKGWVASQWLSKKHDFVLAIGDDFTDEEMFKALPASAYSLKVGRGQTRARYRVANYKDIRTLLNKLAA